MDTTPTIKGPLEIIYQDEWLVSINKPCGLLTHKSHYTGNIAQYALQMVRDQIGQYVYPVHRLDRKTSGVLLFALNQNAARNLHRQFENRIVKKEYLAIVRGFFPEDLELDYPLVNEKGKLQMAQTSFTRLSKSELDFCSDKYPTSRFSLIRVNPLTGRMHQIRKHCSHLNHPILGDRPHGCNKQNRYFKEYYDLIQMLLHANSLTIEHPHHKAPFAINAKPNQEFLRIKSVLRL